MYQLKYELNPPKSINKDIVIVDLDKDSVWLKDRTNYFADLIKIIAEKGKPKVIGIDIIYDDSKIPKPPPNNNKYMSLDCPYKPDKHPEEMKLGCLIKNLKEAQITDFVLIATTDSSSGTLVYPMNLLLEASRDGIGFYGIPGDYDGVHREGILYLKDAENRKLCSFSLGVASKALLGIDSKYDVKCDNYKDFPQQPADYELFMPQFLGPERQFQYISANQVLHNVNNDDFYLNNFKNKIVLIGSSFKELQDLKQTPFTRFKQKGKLYRVFMPGVEYHANCVLSLINNHLLKPATDWQNFLWASLFIIFNLIFLVRLRIKYAIFACIALILTNFIIAYLIFIKFSTILYIATTSIVLIAGIPLTYIYKYLSVSRQFGRYVSPDILDLIWKNNNKIILNGEKKYITVLFSDIRGFTTLSEKSNPEKILLLLNEYFESMNAVIYKNNGYLNKFIGDGLMVLYGAPLESKDFTQDAINAVNTGIQMLEEVEKLNIKWKKEYNLDKIQIGIGIHTGDAVVGNIGSSRRLEYSAIGDTVNLSARLESLNKNYNTNIIISENTYNLIKDYFKIIYLDKTTVKGRIEEVNIYTIDK